MDSPTSSVISPIKKRRLHVGISSKVVIAVTERKFCCLEDLIVANGFKLSGYYTDQPCLVPNCKDPACVFRHTCKVMFFGVNTFLSSRVVVIVQHPACTSHRGGNDKITKNILLPFWHFFTWDP